jgi:hypothetical protein
MNAWWVLRGWPRKKNRSAVVVINRQKRAVYMNKAILLEPQQET